jgi:hypothetical protein
MNSRVAHHLSKLEILRHAIGPRPLGSPGWERARRYIKYVLGSLDLDFDLFRFRLPLVSPSQAEVRIFTGGWKPISCSGLLGSPSCRDLEGELRFVKFGREEDYGSSQFSGSPVVVLAALGKIPVSEKARIAARHGAAALLLFPIYSSNPVPVAASFGEAPIPTLIIGSADASSLGQPGLKARISVASETQEFACEDILVEFGEGEPSCLLAAHYDAGPIQNGSSGSAMGAAVLLALLATFRCRGIPGRLTVAFLDAEELVSAGSALYFEFLESNGLIGDLALAVDLNDLGSGGPLSLVVSDEHYGPASRLAFRLHQALMRVGLQASVKTPPLGAWVKMTSYPKGLPLLALKGGDQGRPTLDAHLASQVVEALDMALAGSSTQGIGPAEQGKVPTRVPESWQTWTLTVSDIV